MLGRIAAHDPCQAGRGRVWPLGFASRLRFALSTGLACAEFERVLVMVTFRFCSAVQPTP